MIVAVQQLPGPQAIGFQRGVTCQIQFAGNHFLFLFTHGRFPYFLIVRPP